MKQWRECNVVWLNGLPKNVNLKVEYWRYKRKILDKAKNFFLLAFAEQPEVLDLQTASA